MIAYVSSTALFDESIFCRWSSIHRTESMTTAGLLCQCSLVFLSLLQAQCWRTHTEKTGNLGIALLPVSSVELCASAKLSALRDWKQLMLLLPKKVSSFYLEIKRWTALWEDCSWSKSWPAEIWHPWSFLVNNNVVYEQLLPWHSTLPLQAAGEPRPTQSLNVITRCTTIHLQPISICNKVSNFIDIG